MKVDAPETQNSFDSLFSAGRLLLTLGLLIFITYPGLVLGTRAFCYRDTGLFSYPVAYCLRDSIRHGHWPLWNPCSDCGLPFLAQWNTLALYPLSLFYVLLPMPWSLNIFLLGHLLLGGLGMYWLAQHWFGSRFAASVAGVVFAWNGLSLQCLMWPCHTAGLAWTPWVVWLCDRAVQQGGRRIYWAALVGGCQMLTGSPETILLTWLIVAVGFVRDVLRERPEFWMLARRLVCVVVLICALSAAQMLPFLDLLAHGDRTSGTGNGYWSLPPWGMANFFVPLFHSSSSLSGVFTQDKQQWTSSYYIGVVPLALAIVAFLRARKGRTLLLTMLALAGVLLALGDAGLVLNILKRAVPILGFIRFPVKFLILTVFCLALLAGAGAAWLQKQSPDAVRRSCSGPGIVIGLIVLLVLAVAFWFPFASDSWSAVWPNALGRLAFLLTGLALLTLIFRSNATSQRALLSFGFLVLMGLDICTHVPQQNPSVPVQAYADDPPPMTKVPQVGESRAMLNPLAERTMDNLVNPDLLHLYLGQRAELFSDCNLLNGIPLVGGFMSVHVAAEQTVAELLRSGKAAPAVAEFLGVSQVASPSQLFVWEARTNFMPWATIGQAPVFLDNDATLAALCSLRFLPRRMAYLPSDARGQITAGADGQARILSSHFGTSECAFETSAESRTMLVVAQAYYHCWRASVDGTPVPLWRANYAFQALEVPPGKHEVRLVYVDRAFQAGAIISIMALMFCLAMIWKGPYRCSDSRAD
ncbi:MAG TPA: YfhO family protein [Verrucomicrobiae bacterium]|nr:YfhO family protein [Verrucomicrobiae bacterium]